jgi:signal transduction histidine kinase
MLLVGLIIMAMPISGLYLFRIYENELVRQTEAELIAQAALVGAMFKAGALELGGANYGLRLSTVEPEAGPGPVQPRLDLARDEIRQDEEGSFYRASPFEPDPVALTVGRQMEPVLQESARINLSSIIVLDYRGLVVAGERGHGLSLADVFEVSEALSGHSQSVLRERPRGKTALSSPSRSTPFRVFFALPVMNGDRLAGAVYLSRTPRDIAQALFYHERRNVVPAALLSLGLAALVSLIVSLMIVTPVKRLAAEAKTVAEGQGQSVGEKSSFIAVRELAELRSVVADMAERLRRRSDYLKAFASGVSHEFKTPLTSIRGAVELLGEHGEDMDSATRNRFEGNIISDLGRLERLVARLLALARAEARTEIEGGRTEAKALAESLAGHYKNLGLTIEIEAPPGTLEAAVSKDALETVLRNLLDNSLAAGATRSAIKLGFDGFQRFGVIRVSDNGPGVPQDAAESIFQPFFTTRKNAGGTGLGLALARTLLGPYRGELAFLGNEPGAAFSITVPLVRPEEIVAARD